MSKIILYHCVNPLEKNSGIDKINNRSLAEGTY